MSECHDYVCERCGRTFHEQRSEEEVKQEAMEDWGTGPDEDYVKLCDDCYKLVLGELL